MYKQSPLVMFQERGSSVVGTRWNDGLPLSAGQRLCLDFGKKRVGHIELEFQASLEGSIRTYAYPHPEAEVPVIFSAEHYGKPEYPLAWGTHISGPLRFQHGAGIQTSRSPKTYAFRYLSLTPERDVVLRSARLLERECSIPAVGVFECSDPLVNRAWQMGTRTLQLCVQPATDSQHPIGREGDTVLWDGCRRDREIWSGDLRPSALALYALTPDASSVRTSLRLLAERRFEDGLIPASASSRQVFFEYALWWIITLWEYYWHTADRDFVREMEPALKGQLAWFERHVTSDRLLEVTNTWAYTLPRSGVLSGANMVLAHAMDCVAALVELSGEDGAVYRAWSEQARQTVVSEFYDPDKHVFNDQRRTEGWDGRTWEDNNTQAVLLGIAPQCEWHGILDNLRARLWRQRGAVVCDPLFDPASIQNENRWAHNGTIWPFVNAYEVGAWMKAGRVAEGLDLLKRFTGACAEAGTETIWEMMYQDGRIPASPDNRYLLSMCHAWGATGNYYLMRYVLGVEVLEPGFGRVRISPDLGPLEWARGVVPTPHGPLSIEVRREATGQVKVKVLEKPKGVELEY
ncbi:MAG: amylo-alpha-1,6-glucosidase [bacterium]